MTFSLVLKIILNKRAINKWEAYFLCENEGVEKGNGTLLELSGERGRSSEW